MESGEWCPQARPHPAVLPTWRKESPEGFSAPKEQQWKSAARVTPGARLHPKPAQSWHCYASAVPFMNDTRGRGGAVEPSSVVTESHQGQLYVRRVPAWMPQEAMT